MRFPELLVFFVHFLNIFNNVQVKCQVPDELIPVLYLKYLDAVNSDESQPSLRRVFHHNTEYNIHVRKLKEVNGLKRHNLEIKVIGRVGAPEERFYINNPVEAKISKAFLTLEEFKEVLRNRVNYKSITKKVIFRNANLDSAIVKPNRTTTMKSPNLVSARYAKLVKGLPLRNSPKPLAVLKEKVKTTSFREGTLSMSKVSKDKYSIIKVTTENTLSTSTTKDFTNVTEIKSTEKVTNPNKIEDITTVYDSITDSNLSYIENPDEMSTITSESEMTVTDNTARQIEANTEEVPTDETEVETSTETTARRSSLSRPLVFEMNDKKEH